MSVAELLERYGSNVEDGLTEAQAAEVLQRDGPNVLTPPKQMPEIVKFLLQMFGGFSALLWLGAILCFLSYGVERGTKGPSASDDNVSWAAGVRSVLCANMPRLRQLYICYHSNKASFIQLYGYRSICGVTMFIIKLKT